MNAEECYVEVRALIGQMPNIDKYRCYSPVIEVVHYPDHTIETYVLTLTTFPSVHIPEKATFWVEGEGDKQVLYMTRNYQEALGELGTLHYSIFTEEPKEVIVEMIAEFLGDYYDSVISNLSSFLTHPLVDQRYIIFTETPSDQDVPCEAMARYTMQNSEKLSALLGVPEDLLTIKVIMDRFTNKNGVGFKQDRMVDYTQFDKWPLYRVMGESLYGWAYRLSYTLSTMMDCLEMKDQQMYDRLILSHRYVVLHNAVIQTEHTLIGKANPEIRLAYAKLNDLGNRKLAMAFEDHRIAGV